jgi:capsular exopolysaccharide synthesis family protein
LGLGAVLASLVGFGLAFLVDWSDQAFRNPQEISSILRAQVLGKVPVIRDALKSKNRAAALITLHRTNSVASEAFRAIRSAVVYNAARDGHKVLMLTSPSPGDGKSTVAANLAMSLAQMGKKIILIDADYRRPRAHQLFDVDIRPGMVDFIQGDMDIDSVIRPVPEIPGLHMLTSGGYPENPGELVSSNQFADIISDLRSRYDYVLIDSPPVLAVADAAGMASLVDTVLLTIRIRRGVIVASQKAKEQLDLVNAPVGGIIVNGLDNNPYYSDYGRYGYRHGYGFGYGSYSTYGRYYDSQKEKYHDRPSRFQESS